MERDIAVITAAINRQHTIEIEYAPGRRLVEPYTLGRSSDGHLLLRAYQICGASESGEDSHWKLFRVDRTTMVAPTNSGFVARAEYRKGDRAMKGGIISEL